MPVSASASSSTTREATPLRKLCTAAPPRSIGLTGTPVNAVTVSGPVTYAKASAVITTWSTSPSTRAGPDTHGPTTASIVGTTPDASLKRPGHASPAACSDSTPSPTSAPEVATRADHRHAEVDPEAYRPLERLALGHADRAAVLAAVEAEPADRSPVQIRERRGDGVAALCHHRRRRRRREQRRHRAAISLQR